MSMGILTRPCFQHGRVVLSPGVVALALQGTIDVIGYVKRHLHGDWGQLLLFQAVCVENDLNKPKRLISRYVFNKQHELWIVTSKDRSTTTLLLPHESNPSAQS